MSKPSRWRSQDGFIREAVWIVVILAVLSVVVLDGMAIFNAHQSAGDQAANAAQAAQTEYAQSVSVPEAKLAADQYLADKGLELLKFSATATTGGSVRFDVTARAHTETYAFHYLSAIPQLKAWVARTTHPVGTGSAQE